MNTLYPQAILYIFRYLDDFDINNFCKTNKYYYWKIKQQYIKQYDNLTIKEKYINGKILAANKFNPNYFKQIGMSCNKKIINLIITKYPIYAYYNDIIKGLCKSEKINIDLFRYVFKKYKKICVFKQNDEYLPPTTIAHYAAQYGKLEYFLYLISKVMEDDEKDYFRMLQYWLESACKGCNIHIIKHILNIIDLNIDNKCKNFDYGRSINGAVISGNYEIMDLIFERDFCMFWSLTGACNNGNLELIKYIAKKCDGVYDFGCYMHNNTMDIINFLKSLPQKYDVDNICYNMENIYFIKNLDIRLNIIQFALEMGFNPNHGLCTANLAENGDICSLSFLLNNGLTDLELPFESAVIEHKFEIVELFYNYLYKQNNMKYFKKIEKNMFDNRYNRYNRYNYKRTMEKYKKFMITIKQL